MHKHSSYIDINVSVKEIILGETYRATDEPPEISSSILNRAKRVLIFLRQMAALRPLRSAAT